MATTAEMLHFSVSVLSYMYTVSLFLMFYNAIINKAMQTANYVDFLCQWYKLVYLFLTIIIKFKRKVVI